MANELLISLMTFYPPVKTNVANHFDKHDEKKFHAYFWLWQTVLLYLIDDITIQLHKRL